MESSPADVLDLDQVIGEPRDSERASAAQKGERSKAAAMRESIYEIPRRAQAEGSCRNEGESAEPALQKEQDLPDARAESTGQDLFFPDFRALRSRRAAFVQSISLRVRHALVLIGSAT